MGSGGLSLILSCSVALPVGVELTAELADAALAGAVLASQFLGAVALNHVQDDVAVTGGQSGEPCREVESEADLIRHRGAGVVGQGFGKGIVGEGAEVG